MNGGYEVKKRQRESGRGISKSNDTREAVHASDIKENMLLGSTLVAFSKQMGADCRMA